MGSGERGVEGRDGGWRVCGRSCLARRQHGSCVSQQHTVCLFAVENSRCTLVVLVLPSALLDELLCDHWRQLCRRCPYTPSPAKNSAWLRQCMSRWEEEKTYRGRDDVADEGPAREEGRVGVEKTAHGW